MDLLRENVKKATSLPLIDKEKFFRLQGLSQAARDREMNEKKVKPPQNIEILEDPFDNIDDYVDNQIETKVKSTFDRHAISATIKEVNGGCDFSNRNWEKLWSEHLEHLENITRLEKEKSQRSLLHNEIKEYFGSQSAIKDLENESIKQTHKIFRNAAIMGLINIKKITLEDLELNINNEESAIKKNKSEALHGTASNYIVADDKKEVELVPLHEDPEILVHPLQVGLDAEKYKDIDFTVARVGKKTKETPQQYFNRTTTDESFNFVKKEST